MKDPKRWLYELLFPTDNTIAHIRIFESFFVGLIIANVVALILETVHSVYDTHKVLFHWFDVISVMIFTVEYIVRIWVVNLHPDYPGRFKGRLRYAFTPLAICDLLAILPFYIPAPMHGADLRSLRIMRLFRLFRIFKITRYIRAMNLIKQVIESRKEQLFISFGIVVFMLTIVSCIMYYVEHDAQPEIFSSIPATMWWGVATLTTVGYGDILPVTPLGKFLGALIAIMGVGLFAIPAGIMASGFSEVLGLHRHHHGHYCPHCGKSIDLEE